MYAEGKGVEQNFKEAFKWYQKAADQGRAKAQNILGSMYAEGKGVEQDLKKALKCYQKAAEQGDATGQISLGLMYGLGKGTIQDYVTAYAWAEIAAANGDKNAPKFKLEFLEPKMTPAQIAEGQKLSREMLKKNPKLLALSLSLPLVAAEKGDAQAQFNLGVMYYQGKGVKQNFKEALKWFQKAAEQGLAEAQSNLGVMYAKGQGMARDYKEAVKWYRKAADQGLAAAQASLGMMYFQGRGVLEDFVQAYAWLNIAGANGLEIVEKGKTLLAKKMTPDQIAESQKLSSEMVKKNPKLLK